ncbi:unnamed protein product [Agarophyton chilense]
MFMRQFILGGRYKRTCAPECMREENLMRKRRTKDSGKVIEVMDVDEVQVQATEPPIHKKKRKKSDKKRQSQGLSSVTASKVTEKLENEVRAHKLKTANQLEKIAHEARARLWDLELLMTKSEVSEVVNDNRLEHHVYNASTLMPNQ